MCNLVDGKVEAVASGEAQQLILFEQWLQHGPPMAKVNYVNVSNWENAEEFTEFSIR